MAEIPRFSLNCDMGEGYYRWNLGPDEELMKVIDVANVACGFHAGDHQTMLKTVRLAKKYGVRIGAHPGLDDLKGFGRRKIAITPEEAYTLALYQVGALKAIVEAEGEKLSHVKPHGVFYHLLFEHEDLMRAFAKAHVSLLGRETPFFGVAGTWHEKICKEEGITFIAELFVDIDYSPEGELLGVAPSRPPNPELIAKKLERIFETGETYDIKDNLLKLKGTEGKVTVCLHSDMPTALSNAATARKVFDRYVGERQAA